VLPGSGQAKGKVFALAPKAMNNPFFDQARDGCVKAAKEIGGVECLFIGPADATEQEQVQVVQDLITKRVDGIGVSAANAPAIAKVLARRRQAGDCIEAERRHTYCIQSGGPAAANMNDRIKDMVETLPADKWKQVQGCPLRSTITMIFPFLSPN